MAAATAQRLDDEARLAVLARTGLLDSPPEEAFDRLTRLACHLLKVPTALVTLVTDRRQFFKSATGLDEPIASQRETDLSHSFCKMVVEGGVPLVVPDARADPSWASHPALAAFGLVAYLGVPLTFDGQTLGAVCGIDCIPREWSAEDARCLRELAELVTADITLRERFRLLAAIPAAGEMSHAARLQELGAHSAGITHDLKNVLHALSGNIALLRTALQLGDAVATPKLLDTVDHLLEQGAAVSGRVLAMARADDAPPALAGPPVSVAPTLDWVAERFARQHGAVQIQVACAADAPPVTVPTHELETVLSNLTENARHALPDGGTIVLDANLDVDPAGPAGRPLAPGRYCRVSVCDTGPGIPREILKRIGEAFFTTKGPSSGTGLGLPMARAFAERAGGGLAIETSLGKGTSVHVWLPAA